MSTGSLHTDGALAEEFAGYRAHLLALGYRLTGSVSDAEDAVQEGWLRLAGLSAAGREEIRDREAWLVTVVSRICLDRLRSAAARRERYVGQWLPEPIVTSAGGAADDPLDAVVRDEGVRMAAMVVLEHLTPEQRVAVVLHDGFGLPFTDIAGTLGCSPDAARQHGSRGRRALAEADMPARAEFDTQRQVLERFVAAVRAGDMRAVAEVLHPDVVFVGDSGGKARTARQVVAGADKVIRLFQGLLEMYDFEALIAGAPVLVNGDLGLHIPASVGSDGRRGIDTHVQTMAIRHGLVVAIYDVANPDKLTHVG